MRIVATAPWIGAGLLAIAAVLGCGSRERGSHQNEDTEDAGVAVADPPRPLVGAPLGLSSVADFAYSRGAGRKAFKRAMAAERRGEWATVEAQSAAALAADPGHLEAHWLHARALAWLGRHDEVGPDLVAAVAGDWLRWGPRALDNPGFAAYRATPQGAQLVTLVEQYREQLRAVARDGLWLVGRRGKAWRPREAGAVSINHRAEIYAYDFELQRFARLSRTNASTVAFVRAPAGRSAAYVAYRKLWLPTDDQRAAGRVPYVRELSVGTLDADGPRMSEREVVFTNVRSIELWYASAVPGAAAASPAAPALLARVWSVDDDGVPAATPQLYVLDTEAGRAAPLSRAADEGDVLIVGVGRRSVRRARVAGVAADWDRRGAAGAFLLSDTRKTITVPAGGSAARDTMSWSARRARLAFATQPRDACGERPADREAVLYVVDASTGKLQELARGEHDFAPIWLDDARLAFTAAPVGGDGGVRIYDAEVGRERVALSVAGGAGTRWLPAAARCDGADAVSVDDASDGADSDGDGDWDDDWDDDDGIGVGGGGEGDAAASSATAPPAAPAESAR